MSVTKLALQIIALIRLYAARFTPSPTVMVSPPFPQPMSLPLRPTKSLNALPNKLKHENNGACAKCIEVRDRYPGFNTRLWSWFADFQKKHPEFHISCAGRGKIDQNALFARHATKASWGHSAHNFNCALDSFVLIPGSEEIYPLTWYHSVLAPALPEWISWLGRPDSPFPELPHLEISEWGELHRNNQVQLVE